MINPKKVYNQTRLRNLKRASLKYKEAQLELQISDGVDDKMIAQTMSDISRLKSEIESLK